MKPSIDLILGTALWAWTVSKEQAFQLLDKFYEAGYRWIDAATNYPINKNANDFRASEGILCEWIKANGVQDLKVLMKIGSINNLYTPENNLTPSFIQIIYNEYLHLFGEQLAEVMVHWDNRAEADAIRASLLALDRIRQEGVKIGLSGIKHPAIYHELNSSFGFDWDIQLKHNLVYSDYDRYSAFHGQARFLAYGINAGGLKFPSATYRKDSSTAVRNVPTEKYQDLVHEVATILTDYNAHSSLEALTRFNECSMVYTYYSPDIKGILVGPSKTAQLQSTLTFFEQLQAGQHEELYNRLAALSSNG
ncbi:MAG: aldo/keto reductase [Saprospiraceae bacterium]|nr:aldo/keto reductase [Saprospiraceae bacterium]